MSSLRIISGVNHPEANIDVWLFTDKESNAKLTLECFGEFQKKWKAHVATLHFP